MQSYESGIDFAKLACKINMSKEYHAEMQYNNKSEQQQNNMRVLTFQR